MSWGSPSWHRTITVEEAQRLAALVRLFARVKPAEQIDLLRLARRVCPVRIVPRLGSGRGMLGCYRDIWMISIRSHMRDRDEVLAHELGHWAMIILAGRSGHTEGDADEIGTALLGRVVDTNSPAAWAARAKLASKTRREAA